ncbi:MAG: preprotein translocase subunit SecE [Clostridia bacterium]|nr:preprotein translocase subunit SecE [Clostridia bacterium]
MSKKNKLENEVSNETEVSVDNGNEQVAQSEDKKEKQKIKSDAKKEKDTKQKKKTNVNASEKRTLGQKAKATISELKKVTWPSFGNTVKQTGVVIAFVLLFIVILLGLNSLFGWLFNLIVG